MKRRREFWFVLGFLLLFATGGMCQTSGVPIRDVVTDQAIGLAGEWRYQIVTAITKKMVAPGYPDAGWPKTNAPASWAEQGIIFESGSIPVVLYRRTITVPAAWQGRKIGISCWFSRNAAVYLNGTKIEPKGPLYARFANVSKLLHYGQENLVAVTAMYEGNLEINDSCAPRIGPLGERSVTEVTVEDVQISGGDTEAMAATIYRPAGKVHCPALIMLATVHHDSVIKEVWSGIADDLARSGYLCLALQADLAEASIRKTIDYLATRPEADSGGIGIIGASTAGKICLMAADHDPRLRTAIILSGPKIGPEEAQLELPVLLIASVNDSRGPLAFYAEKAAGQLGKPGKALILPDQEHGTELLDTKWNTVRRAMLDWLAAYLPARRP